MCTHTHHGPHIPYTHSTHSHTYHTHVHTCVFMAHGAVNGLPQALLAGPRGQHVERGCFSTGSRALGGARSHMSGVGWGREAVPGRGPGGMSRRRRYTPVGPLCGSLGTQWGRGGCGDGQVGGTVITAAAGPLFPQPWQVLPQFPVGNCLSPQVTVPPQPPGLSLLGHEPKSRVPAQTPELVSLSGWTFWWL